MTDHVLPGQPYPTATDPTAVMGRRIVAWLLDLAMFLAVVAGTFAVLAAPVDVPETVAVDACDVLQDRAPDEAAGCFEWGDDRVYITSNGDNLIQTFVSLFYLADFIVLQGVTGGSPGKLLTGLRVVDERGRNAGVGRSLVRTLLWIVDGAPWVVPFVGFITGLTSTGHRRVGDLAAKTYVVHRAAVGSPPAPQQLDVSSGVPPQWAPPPPALSATGSYAPSSWPAAPPHAAPTDPATAEVDPDEVDAIVSEAAPTGGPATTPAPDDLAEQPTDIGADPAWWSGPESATDADPAAGWEPPTTPGEDFTTVSDDRSPTAGPTPFVAPGSAAPPPLAPPAELPPPQWDQARGTYIQWDPRREQWLQWDAAAARWEDIR